MDRPAVNALLLDIVQERDGFGLEVKVTGSESSINRDKVVIRMRDNSKVQTASFVNGDGYEVTFVNDSKLPVYVIYGGAAKPGGHVAILDPESRHTINSFEEGGDSFKVLTKEYNDSKSGLCGKATFKKDIDLHRAVFLSAQFNYCSDKTPSNYIWKKEYHPVLLSVGSKKKKKKKRAPYQDDTLEEPLAKTVPGEKSALTFRKTGYAEIINDCPLLAEALLGKKTQVAEFQWRAGDVDHRRDPADYIPRELPDEYITEVSTIFNGLRLAAEAKIGQGYFIKKKERVRDSDSPPFEDKFDKLFVR